ncbi:MAG: S49 family peptidase [Geminicoccaceae bacterium]
MPDLPHLASRLLGTPLLLARPKLDVILATLGPRLLGTGALLPLEQPAPAVRELVVTPEGVAVVPVVGTLVARSGWLDAASGLTSYAELGAGITEAMADPAIRAVLLEVDSLGGEVGGLFDLVENIREAKAASGKPLWAVASESALSAAYAIASTADRLLVTRTGEIGSIGVVAAHLDESGADAQAGHRWSFVHAGARKVDGNPHEPLSDRARMEIQADVDGLYEQLVSVVARNRQLSPEAVRASEAAVYRGARAVELGLADAVGITAIALVELTRSIQPKRPSLSNPRAATARHPTRHHEVTMTTTPVEPLPDETVTQESELPPVTPTAIPNPPLTAPAAEVETRLRAELAELLAIGAQAQRLGVAVDAADAMARGIRPEALRRAVLDQLAARAEASSLVALAPAAAPAAGDSPIVRRARERAAAAV